jgi:hypothetical protein
MTEPKPLTEKYILSQIAFHEAGVQFYAEHRDRWMAEWSQTMVNGWKAKLERLAIKAEEQPEKEHA